jgi:YidC/Oxa1 family membrane protein insertase
MLTLLSLLPLNMWDDFMRLLDAMMQPLYWAVSGVMVGFHWLLSFVLDPDWGVTWALSIVLLTVVIRTLLIPLFVRQINSARNVQLLQPKLKELNAKYGSDREKLGQETMKLYKEEGVNPMASCMPILLQMPIFIALFNVLNSVSRTVVPENATGYLPTVLGHFFQQDATLVTSLQKATIFGAHISQTFLPMTSFGPTQVVALVLIVLMTVVLFLTQMQLMRKNMPPDALTGPMAQQQKMMLYMFPAMYAIGGVNIPIGVLIYWLTTNTWNMGQQYLLIHNNPAPGTPAYIDWEERMRARGKDPDEIAAKRRGTSKRAAADPSKVARQSAASPVSEASEGGVQRQVIQRQQPRKNTRSARKK